MTNYRNSSLLERQLPDLRVSRFGNREMSTAIFSGIQCCHEFLPEVNQFPFQVTCIRAEFTCDGF